MNTIETAIKEFRQKRLAVYKADPQQIVRDPRGAERATNDHTGRWLFELLQNSDDAKASEVRIFIGDNTVYVADNGCGLKPEAISAICGTDFSDKASGTIGRKGVGFKSAFSLLHRLVSKSAFRRPGNTFLFMFSIQPSRQALYDYSFMLNSWSKATGRPLFPLVATCSTNGLPSGLSVVSVNS